ncbi:UDP-N-acetylmuramoyl-tripeptide--D-alanyl-D-alanine ligase [Prosthecochloris sp. CIB 2401]|nr:UDP-N-acetylmuramoyl-tripeptide--D-alanyl-D-alanine ligase [Prosthecochloris sp. CIB 2401]
MRSKVDMGMCLERTELEAVGVLAGYPEGGDVRWCNPVAVIDSRLIEGGELFFALQGERMDGHDFVQAAFDLGAACAIVSREWFSRQGASIHGEGMRYLVVHDPVKALQQLAGSYRAKFTGPVIGIGGSNGKTTTKEMVAAVLAEKYCVHASKGNLNNHLGVPLTLLGLRSCHEMAVIEMGINHPGEMALLCSVAKPDFGFLTNIGHEHLEFLGDLDGVAMAETELYRDVDSRGGTVFLNELDARLAAAAGGLQHVVPFGAPDGKLHARHIVLDAEGRPSFTLCHEDGEIPLTLNFAGRHNVHNSLGAATVGFFFGCSPLEVRRGLESLLPEGGWKRLEVFEANGVRVFNDTYNANPDSALMAMKTVCEVPCSGRRIMVLGDMLELGESSEEAHRSLGELVSRLPFHALYTYGGQAAGSCRSAGSKCRGHFTSHNRLLELLKQELEAGDLLLLKGSRGMRLERIAEGLRMERIQS